MTNDSQVARGEDEVGAQREDMSPKGGKGPGHGAVADTEGAFGDRDNSTRHESSTADSLSEGPRVFDETGGG